MENVLLDSIPNSAVASAARYGLKSEYMLISFLVLYDLVPKYYETHKRVVKPYRFQSSHRNARLNKSRKSYNIANPTS